MKLRSRSDAEVMMALHSWRDVEKEAVTEILLYLIEVERRKLHLQTYSSLYQFCREELGYSKDEAYLRIRAMELLRALPEIEQDLRESKLSLTTMAQAQVAFRSEDSRRKDEGEATLSLEAKREIVSQITENSSRDAKRVLAAHFPNTTEELESIRALDGDLSLISFPANSEELAKFERLKDLLAHKNYDRKWRKLFAELAEIGLDKLDPERKKQRREERSARKSEKECRSDNRDLASLTANEAQKSRVADKAAAPSAADAAQPFGAQRNRRQYISVHTNRELKAQAGYRCEHIDPRTGKRCPSTHALQIDHMIPLAMGGSDAPNNLRVLCAEHNRYSAWQMGLSRHRSGSARTV